MQRRARHLPARKKNKINEVLKIESTNNMNQVKMITEKGVVPGKGEALRPYQSDTYNHGIIMNKGLHSRID